MKPEVFNSRKKKKALRFVNILGSQDLTRWKITVSFRNWGKYNYSWNLWRLLKILSFTWELLWLAKLWPSTSDFVYWRLTCSCKLLMQFANAVFCFVFFFHFYARCAENKLCKIIFGNVSSQKDCWYAVLCALWIRLNLRLQCEMVVKCSNEWPT